MLAAFCGSSGWSFSLRGAFVESFNASLSIDQALLTRIKRMAHTADLNPYERLGGAGGESVAAGTSDLSKSILWVDSFFHGCFLVVMRKR